MIFKKCFRYGLKLTTKQFVMKIQKIVENFDFLCFNSFCNYYVTRKGDFYEHKTAFFNPEI